VNFFFVDDLTGVANSRSKASGLCKEPQSHALYDVRQLFELNSRYMTLRSDDPDE